MNAESVRLAMHAMQCMQRRDFGRAEVAANRSLRADAANTLALKVLGQCRVQRGDNEGALLYFELAVARDPDDAQAQYAMGTVLRKLYRLQEALAGFQRAADLSHDPDAEVEAADLQQFLALNGEAVRTCRRALETAPSSFRANLSMAGALMAQGEADEAEVYWRRAEKLEPQAGQTRLTKAMSSAKSGRFNIAEGEAREAIERNPRLGRSYYVLFSARRVTEKDRPLIEQMERLLALSEISEEDRANLQYALGKAYDNLGEYEMAMARFDRANQAQRRVSGSRPFDPEHLRRSVDAQIAMFTQAVLSSVAEAETDLPLFVAGMARSGTTLVDQILSSHPDVGSAGEQGFWLDYEGSVVSYERRQVNGRQAARLKDIYRSLLATLAPGFRLVIDKNPANLMVSGLLHVVFPSSRMICTRRHAVDTALSLWMTSMQTEAPFVHDRANLVIAYKQCMRLMDHWRDTMPPSRYLEVRYESLVDRPEEHTRQMLAFCGLDWNEACLHPEDNDRTIRTPSFWQVRQPIYRTSVARWKNYEPWLREFSELMDMW